MKILARKLFFLCVTLTTCSGLNILGIFPHPSKSHFIAFEPLLKALAAKGHNLTIVGHFPLKKPISGYKDISLRGDTEIQVAYINVDELPKGQLIYYFGPLLLRKLAKNNCKDLHTPQMRKFLNSDNKFDLIITETFNSDCFLGFVHKFKVPFIGLSSCTIMPWSNNRFGNPVNPSYIPSSMLPHSDKMNFLERVENTIFYLYAEFIFQSFIQKPEYEEAKKFFGDDLPPLNEIANNISLMLINTHFSLNLPRPLVPNIVEVGGMFIGKQKSLPEHLEKYLTDSPNGVIYFSMGSRIKGHSFSEERRAVFLNVFSKLKQRVLWKWETESLPDKPPNIMIQKWMPQFDILCHPNVVAFISHGGLLGTTEAVYCGVPMIIMPQYGDQFTNAKAVEANGGGVIVNFASVDEETLLKSLNTVLEPSFRKHTKELSAIYKDRPLSPMDTAIYWVEYVARHKGAHHMKSAAVDMPLYQYLLLDVFLFIAGVLAIILAINYFIIKTILHKIFGSKSNKQKIS